MWPNILLGWLFSGMNGNIHSADLRKPLGIAKPRIHQLSLVQELILGCPQLAPSLIALHFCHWFLSDSESIFHCNGNQTGGDLGATWGRPWGDLKWALAQDWVGESKVWQCLGASWDLQNSRYVPYLPIHSRLWAVRACKEKLHAFKDIGLPPDFHKKSGGEPV